MFQINKAIFPVAGLGTRLLPATKSGPKEMMTLIDKPLLQYAVEEAMEAGITEMIFVTGQWKHIVTSYFEKCYALEKELTIRQNWKLLQAIQNIKPSHVQYHYVDQPAANGLGQAVLCAEKLIKDSPFALILVDDLILNKPPVIQQMIQVFQKKKCSIIAIEKIARKDTAAYGIINVTSQHGRFVTFNTVIEKPKPEHAPSTFGIVGRYIFTQDIFSHLHELKTKKHEEKQLTDGIQKLLAKKPVLGYQYIGQRFDCGTKIGYLKAMVTCALQHPQIKKPFHSYLKNLKI